MYTLKLTHGYVDEPETWTTEALGIYESLDEACEAAEREFHAALEDLTDPDEDCYGEVEACLDDYYATYGAYDPELGRVFAGYDMFVRVSVIERRQHRRQRQARQARQLVCRI